MKLFTAGHSTSGLREFVSLLSAHDIDVVVDVRSKPRSRLPHFDLIPLRSAMEASGLRYRFAGDRLGGMPRDPQILRRWKQGRLDPVIIDHLRSTDEWLDGIGEITSLVKRDGGTNVCIICSEADPNECHRKAVALDAANAIPGLEIVHLGLKSGMPTEVGVQEVLM